LIGGWFSRISTWLKKQEGRAERIPLKTSPPLVGGDDGEGGLSLSPSPFPSPIKGEGNKLEN
jgi:hypothetical protein